MKTTQHRRAYYFSEIIRKEVKRYMEAYISLAERETGCKMKTLTTNTRIEDMNNKVR